MNCCDIFFSIYNESLFKIYTIMEFGHSLKYVCLKKAWWRKIELLALLYVENYYSQAILNKVFTVINNNGVLYAI